MNILNLIIFTCSRIRTLVQNENSVHEKLRLLLIILKLSFKHILLINVLKINMQHEKIFNFKIRFPSYSSFYGFFSEIFIEEEYAFKSDTQKPFIIDCGSHIGMSVLYFKKVYPEAKIICFEPHKCAFDLLHDNILNNSLKNVQLNNVAVSNRNGIIRMYSDPESHSLAGTSIRKRLLGKNKKLHEDEIRSVLLSEFIDTSVDFLKMDIEGAEAEVLEELSKSLKLKYIKELIIEYHSNILTNPNNKLSRILDILEIDKFQYVIFNPGKPPFYLKKNKPYNVLVYAYK